MRKLIIIIFASVILLSLSPVTASEQQLTPADTLAQLQMEIQVINMVNSLDLTPDQMRFITEKARLVRIMNELYKIRTAEIIETLDVSLLELKKKLIQKQELSPETQARIDNSQKELATIKTNYAKKRLEIAAEVKYQLNGDQLYIIDSNDATLIPPKNTVIFSNKTVNTDFAQSIVKEVRAMPEGKYQKKKNNFATQIIKNIEPALPAGFIIDMEKEKSRILAFFVQARQMSESEFGQRQAEILEAFKSKYVIPKLSAGIEAKIDRYLLHEGIIVLLKQRLSEN